MCIRTSAATLTASSARRLAGSHVATVRIDLFPTYAARADIWLQTLDRETSYLSSRSHPSYVARCAYFSPAARKCTRYATILLRNVGETRFIHLRFICEIFITRYVMFVSHRTLISQNYGSIGDLSARCVLSTCVTSAGSSNAYPFRIRISREC